jgi:mannose-6-phosphate isomerase-like protein (cupin superfamily)
VIDADRDFGGQRFVRHVASEAAWGRWHHPGFECRDTGISAASRGAAGALVTRAAGATSTPVATHDGELLLMFVLCGRATVEAGGHVVELATADSIVVPAGDRFRLTECSEDLELLEVTVPGSVTLHDARPAVGDT